MDERENPFTKESDEAWRASVRLESYYIGAHSQIRVVKPIEELEVTDEQARRILLNLAYGIIDQTIQNHEQVACILRGLKHKFSEEGGSSEQINYAALIVDLAVSEFSEFRGPDPKGWTFKPEQVNVIPRFVQNLDRNF